MTDTKQPEALELASLLENFAVSLGEHPSGSRLRAVNELRRQHAELLQQRQIAFDHALAFDAAKDRIAELEAENRTLKEQHEAIGAGGVTWLRGAAIAQKGQA